MNDGDISVLDNMARYGGGFAKRLAQAAMAADGNNYLRLKAAFPDFWQTYGKDWPKGVAVEVLQDPSVREYDCFRVSFGGTLTTPCFNSRGAADVYATELRRGTRKPEFSVAADD